MKLYFGRHCVFFFLIILLFFDCVFLFMWFVKVDKKLFVSFFWIDYNCVFQTRFLKWERWCRLISFSICESSLLDECEAIVSNITKFDDFDSLFPFFWRIINWKSIHDEIRLLLDIINDSVFHYLGSKILKGHGIKIIWK